MNYTIVGVSRGSEYSPNHVGNDAAIFNEVAENLKSLGFKVHSFNEREFVSKSIKSDVIFNMARDTKTISYLKELEQQGSLIINSAYGIENCVRKPMTEILISNNIPHPHSQIVSVNNVSPDDIAFYPAWIKRGDSHAIVKEDVCYVTCWEEVVDVINDFQRRNIPTAVINEHLYGDLIKFYGIRGLSYFFWFYPSPCSHSKFGLEKINGEAKGIAFEEETLKKYCEQASIALDVPVYGGDCVISSDGNITIIDFNDWPSFARCREEAAGNIADYISKQAKVKFQEVE